MRRLFIFCMVLCLVLATMPGSVAATPEIREDLQYQVSLGPWSDVARVHLVLKELEPGRYLAEFSGAAQGLWRLLSRWLPQRYTTEMVYREGHFLPLVYREEFTSEGQQVVKEYRFDHQLRRLTLWRQADGGNKVKKWEVPLNGPVHDLLSLIYNVRLGALGPLPEGSNLSVMVLSPEPRKMDFRIGSLTGQGLKVMLDYRSPGSDIVDPYFIFLNANRVPTLAWTRVNFFGKLAGRLLNPGDIRKELLPGMALHN